MRGTTMRGKNSKQAPGGMFKSSGRQRRRGMGGGRGGIARVATILLFLVLGSGGSFLLGVELAAQSLPPMVGSASGSNISNSANSQQGVQALGSLGAATPTTSTTQSHHTTSLIHSKSGKDAHGHATQNPDTPGQPGDQNPPPGAGTGSGTGTASSGAPTPSTGGTPDGGGSTPTDGTNGSTGGAPNAPGGTPTGTQPGTPGQPDPTPPSGTNSPPLSGLTSASAPVTPSA